MPARFLLNFWAGGMRPSSQRPARTKRSAAVIRRQAHIASTTPRSETSSYRTGVVVTTMPRSRALARLVVSSPTPMIVQISTFGSTAITSAENPLMALVATPRMRSAIGRSAATLSFASIRS